MHERRIGPADRQLRTLISRRKSWTRLRTRFPTAPLPRLRDQIRRTVEHCRSELLDEEFDELGCQPELLLRLANQL